MKLGELKLVFLEFKNGGIWIPAGVYTRVAGAGMTQ
jgi:hypothetical protein